MTKDLWPWPADTPTDRARRVARSYRDALYGLDPQLCGRMDAQCAHLGQGWIVPSVLTVQPDDLLTRWQAADYCSVRVNTITKWKARGLAVTETPDGDRYRVGDLIEYQAELRRKRITPAS